MIAQEMSRHPRRCALAVVLSGLVLFAACPLRPPKPADTLVIGVLADIQSWNPYLAESRFTEDVLALVYPSLVEEQPDYQEHPPTFSPALAESWQASEDGLELTFRLNPNARWSDGVQVTADDVVFTWRAQTSPEVGWYGSYIKDFIESVDRVDASTVRFRFTHPYPYQLMDANEGLILPAHVWGAIPFVDWAGADWLPQVVGAGPYLPEQHLPQQQISLVANPENGLVGKPHIERVVWRIVPDQLSLMTQLEAGDFDFVSTIPPALSERLSKNPNLVLLAHRDRGYTHICWNLKRHPLDDRRVRRALSLAIDRQSIIDTVYRGFADPSVGPILSSMWAFNADLKPLPYDPNGARMLLAEAGWRDRDDDGIVDRDGKPLELEILVNAENRMRLDIAVLAAGNLEAIGVSLTPRTVEWGAFLTRMQSGDFDGAVNRWIEPTQIDLEDVWRTAPPTVSTSNYGRYSNPEVDRFIDEAGASPDFATQKPLFDAIQRLIVDDQPYTFLVEGRRINALSRRIHGAVLNDATPYFNLHEWEIR